MEKKTIGKFISALRRAKGMTQKELADRLFVSDKTVSRWECDESTPDLSLIPTIAEIFDITSDELLRGERKSAREETKEGEEAVSEKGKRELRLMLTRRQKRFSNLSLISVALAIVALVVGIALSVIASLPCTAFCMGKVFTEPDSFLAYMEEAKGYDYREDEDTEIRFEPIYGEIDKDYTYEENPHVSIWEVPGKDGEILYSFPYNSRYFAAIEWSFDSSEDGMPVTVYTKAAYRQGDSLKDTLILVGALLLAAAELTLMILYAVKVVGLYEKKKAQG